MLADTSKPPQVPVWHPPSPLAHKRRRLDAPIGQDGVRDVHDTIDRFSPSPIPLPPILDDSPMEAHKTSTPRPAQSHHKAVACLTSNISPRTQRSMDILENDSHRLRLEMVQQEQNGKQTKKTYDRHLKSYQDWWEQTQAEIAAEDSTRVPIPAFPVTATKVTLFLQHESTRAKRKRGSNETIAGSSVGVSHIKGVVSALEFHRFHHQHEYQSDESAQISLRTDSRITAFEKAVQHNEPKRADEAQILKAAGSSSDTYTIDELKNCSIWCLTSTASSAERLFIATRDRAMMLLSSQTAFRGESARMLLWSDLFQTSIPFDEIAPGCRVLALAALADNAKHNQTGRVDEHGALRHRVTELCGVGALALLFFAHFHVLCKPVPEFAPKFDVPQCGQYGECLWYQYHVFWPTRKSPSSHLTYENHRDRVNTIHTAVGISISKSTHATRPFSAQTARVHGASIDGTKALGGWSDSTGSFRPCYDRALPVDAMLGAAMFNARKPESFRLLRDALEPPETLTKEIFPWVEQEQAALEARSAANPSARDYALKNFLSLLLWFRRVILQDVAILSLSYPTAPVLQYAPFNNPTFVSFAHGSSAVITSAEESARVALENLPDKYAHTFRGLVQGATLEQQHASAQCATQLESLTRSVEAIKALLDMQMSSKKSRHRAGKTVLSPPVSQASAEPPQSLPAATTNPPPPPLPPGQLPTLTINITNSPYGLNISPLLPSALAAPPLSAPQQAPAGRSSPPMPVSPMPPFTNDHIADLQHTRWNDLVKAYPESSLRKHSWEWRAEDWLPHYIYPEVTSISTIWEEWTNGVDGYLSTRQLEERWGAKWRRNLPNLKTPHARRKKVIQLVQELSSRHCWDTKLALRFLREKYEPNFSARKFCEYLQKKNGTGWQDVMAAAGAYT